MHDWLPYASSPRVSLPPDAQPGSDLHLLRALSLLAAPPRMRTRLRQPRPSQARQDSQRPRHRLLTRRLRPPVWRGRRLRRQERHRLRQSPAWHYRQEFPTQCRLQALTVWQLGVRTRNRQRTRLLGIAAPCGCATHDASVVRSTGLVSLPVRGRNRRLPGCPISEGEVPTARQARKSDPAQRAAAITEVTPRR